MFGAFSKKIESQQVFVKRFLFALPFLCLANILGHRYALKGSSILGSNRWILRFANRYSFGGRIASFTSKNIQDHSKYLYSSDCYPFFIVGTIKKEAKYLIEGLFGSSYLPALIVERSDGLPP